MATVSEMKARVEGVLDTVLSLAGEVMVEHNEELVALLVYQQAEQHLDSLGNPLARYKPTYSVFKYKITGRGQETDLNLTGEFQSGILLRVDGDQYEFGSPAMTDTGELKQDWLAKWTDAPIMSLTDENKQEAWVIIRPDFVERVKEQLQL